jgi:MFS family permease
MALTWLPMLLGPLAGVVVDRVSKRWLMIACDIIRGLVLIAIYMVYLQGSLQLWHLFLVAVVEGTLAIFYDPSLKVVLPALVPGKDLPAANSSLQAAMSISEIAGLGVAAGVLAALGTGLALALDGITFVFAALAIWLVHFPVMGTASEGLRAGQVWGDLVSGLRLIGGRKDLVSIVIMAFFTNFIVGPANVIFPVLSEQVLGAGVTGYSVLMASFAVGMFLGSLLVGALGDHLNYRTGIAGALAGIAVGMAGLGFASSLIPALALCVLAGLALPLANVTIATHLQRTVPREAQGRVFGSLNALGTLGAPLGLVLGGQALTIVAAPSLLRGIGAITLVIALIWSALMLRGGVVPAEVEAAAAEGPASDPPGPAKVC